MKNIDIIGACSDLGIHINGTSLAPEVLEKSLTKDNINKIINVKPNLVEKELNKNNHKRNLNEINLFNTKLYNTVLESLNHNKFPLTIGGDHSIAIASALASSKKNGPLGIIWFDAHGDYHTFETTPSGNIHGLPFAAVTNYEKKELTNFHTGPFFSPKNAVLVGARDIDLPEEMDNLKKAGVTIITTEDIQKYGAETMYKKAFEIASNGTNGIHISYDLDCIDPKLAPGVSVPAVNGVNLEDAYAFIDYMIKNKQKIKSFDLVEFNPLKDINQVSEKIAINILNNFINNFS